MSYPANHPKLKQLTKLSVYYIEFYEVVNTILTTFRLDHPGYLSRYTTVNALLGLDASKGI